MVHVQALVLNVSSSYIPFLHQKTTLNITLDSNHTFGPRPKLWPKTKTLAQDKNFGPRPKLWTKTITLAQDQNFGPGPKLWPKTKTLAQDQNFGPKNFGLATTLEHEKTVKPTPNHFKTYHICAIQPPYYLIFP